MVFNSLTFVVFFAIVLFLHNLPLSWPIKKFNLLVASYLFYAAWNPPFVLLLWASTVVDWLVARQIHRQETHRVRRAWLIVSLVVNLGFLGFFKYGNFMLQNWQALMNAVGVHYHAPEWNILLPVASRFTRSTRCLTPSTSIGGGQSRSRNYSTLRSSSPSSHNWSPALSCGSPTLCPNSRAPELQHVISSAGDWR